MLRRVLLREAKIRWHLEFRRLEYLGLRINPQDNSPFLSCPLWAARPLGKMVLTNMPIAPREESTPPTILKPRKGRRFLERSGIWPPCEVSADKLDVGRDSLLRCRRTVWTWLLSMPAVIVSSWIWREWIGWKYGFSVMCRNVSNKCDSCKAMNMNVIEGEGLWKLCR